MKKFKIGDRVTLPNHDFLSDGVIIKVIKAANACVIKLDEKAPNTYAWETDEVLMFNVDIKLIGE